MRLGAWLMSALLVLAAAPVACSGQGGDEKPASTGGTGASEALTRLTIGTVDGSDFPDAPIVEYFEEQVEKLSGDQMRIVVLWDAGGEGANFEPAIIDRVRNGDLDLGWIGSRAFDTIGVTSFQALQAPFLIQNRSHLDEVLTSPMAEEMLTGLTDAGLTGLGLYPDHFRHPVGFEAPLASLKDLQGATIRVPTSNAADALMRSLGAKPVHLSGSGVDAARKSGKLDGIEVSIALAPNFDASFATSNIVFYPRVNTLFSSEEVLDRVTSEQQDILRKAAEATLAFALEEIPADADASAFCEAGGTLVAAKDRDLASIEAAARKVYTNLEADPQTKSFIDQIEALKENDAITEVPSSCRRVRP